jgi:hypothetical protein
MTKGKNEFELITLITRRIRNFFSLEFDGRNDLGNVKLIKLIIRKQWKPIYVITENVIVIVIKIKLAKFL